MELWRGTTRKLAVLRLRWRMSTNNGEWFCSRPEGSAMPGLNRSLAMPQDEVGVYHCFNRCVQQAYLCGVDPVTKIDYSHRKGWIRDKIRGLARAFALDLFKISLMDNH